jgi:hypothetical protein
VTLHEVCGLYVFVLILAMFRSYAHEREFLCEKCLLLIMAMSHAYMSLCILLAMLVLTLHENLTLVMGKASVTDQVLKMSQKR